MNAIVLGVFMKDVEQGFAKEIRQVPGRRRAPKVISAVGKDPRIVGNVKASAMNPQCRLPERLVDPTIE